MDKKNKQVGVNGIAECPDCQFEAPIKLDAEIKTREHFNFRCLVCGREYIVYWAYQQAFFLVEENDEV